MPHSQKFFGQLGLFSNVVLVETGPVEAETSCTKRLTKSENDKTSNIMAKSQFSNGSN